MRWIGIVAAFAAVALGGFSANVDARGVSDVNPLGAVALGIGAIALLRASELVD